MTGGAFAEHEEKMLDYLTEMDVSYVDENGGFKIQLVRCVRQQR